MSTTSTAAMLKQERRAQVNAALAAVRAAAGASASPDAAAVATIKTILASLAAQRHLWELEDFPIPAGQVWGVYEVSEDPDGRFALYASAARPGHAQPPHNHTTWACIAGVYGVEVNRLYKIVDGGAMPGPARIELAAEIPLGKGDEIFLGPDEVHDIRVVEPETAMHLHLYGLGLPHLDRRLKHDMAAGTCQYFPVFTGIPKLVD